MQVPDKIDEIRGLAALLLATLTALPSGYTTTATQGVEVPFTVISREGISSVSPSA